MKKALSIIVPSYNMEQYLPKCLGSLVVAPELMERLEVIVVNDGSKDRTSEIAHEFAAKWPQTFVVIDKENGNYGSCVNAALSRASGTYVKMLDADDSYETSNFEKFLKHLETSEADLVISDFEYLNDRGEVIATASYELPRATFDFSEIPGEFCRKVQMQAVAYRLDCVRSVDYRQTEGISYTDQEWMFLPMLKVRRASYFPKVVYKYLQGRPGQTVSAGWLNNRWMAVRVTMGAVRQYGQLARESAFGPAEKYLKNRLMYELETTYQECLLSPAPFAQKEMLIELDKLIQQGLPDVYGEMDELRPPNMFKFKYIKYWRQHCYNFGGIFVVYRFFCGLRRLIRIHLGV